MWSADFHSCPSWSTTSNTGSGAPAANSTAAAAGGTAGVDSLSACPSTSRHNSSAKVVPAMCRPSQNDPVQPQDTALEGETTTGQKLCAAGRLFLGLNAQ